MTFSTVQIKQHVEKHKILRTSDLWAIILIWDLPETKM
jgi:hypothetical protein